MRQALVGLDVINKTIDSVVTGLNIPDRGALVVVDIFGYDGFSAECAINRKVAGTLPQCIVGTVCHTHETKKFVQEIVGRVVYNAAKEGKLQVDGFPVLKDTVDALKAHQSNGVQLGSLKFGVCSCLSDGTLILPSGIVNKWIGEVDYKDRMNKVLELHNEEFNTKGLVDTAPESPHESASKKPRLEARDVCPSTLTCLLFYLPCSTRMVNCHGIP